MYSIKIFFDEARKKKKKKKDYYKYSIKIRITEGGRKPNLSRSKRIDRARRSSDPARRPKREALRTENGEKASDQPDRI